MKVSENIFKGMGGQIDLLNTLYGGTSATTMDLEREANRLVLSVAAAGVSASAFNVLVEGNKLVVYTLLVQDNETVGQRLAVPMYLKTLTIPPFVDADQIEAEHEDGRVTISMPYNEEQLLRSVNLNDLL